MSTRADIEAIINAIGEISKTEALDAIDKLIGCVSVTNERSEPTDSSPVPVSVEMAKLALDDEFGIS